MYASEHFRIATTFLRRVILTHISAAQKNEKKPPSNLTKLRSRTASTNTKHRSENYDDRSSRRTVLDKT